MDQILLDFFNQTLAHPLLDVTMVGLTTLGLALLPVLGLGLLFAPGQKRIGSAILTALIVGTAVALLFQFTVMRPRPEVVRLILSTPGFPAFPSGHTVVAFGVATVIGLSFQQWRWKIMGATVAALIALSRVYLGHHFPSDVFGGVVLGIAVGTACYGLIVLPQPDWRWLLWPQVALVIIISQVAYMGLLPLHLLQWPYADKIMHFLLFGAVVFWLNLWLKGRTIRLGMWGIPVAILVPLTIALLEEGVQAFSPIRSVDIFDLISDLAGMLFFWGLSYKVFRSTLVATETNWGEPSKSGS